MHDIRWIRDNPDEFDRRLGRRPLSDEEKKHFASSALMRLDEERRIAIAHLEKILARRNAASKEIGDAKKKKDEAHAEDLMIEVGQLKAIIPELEKTPRELETKLNRILASVPNLPIDEVPDGPDETANVEHHHFGTKREYAFAPKQHFELGEALGQMDFETAAKLSGARFVVLKSGLARMERALGQFMLDVHTQEHGYTEVNPPLLVRDEAMFGTTQLPKFRDDQFSTRVSDVDIRSFQNRVIAGAGGFGFLVRERPEMFQELLNMLQDGGDHQIDLFASAVTERLRELRQTDPNAFANMMEKVRGEMVEEERNLWLIPTAEVSLTNLVRESIISEEELPLRFTACTPCFRAEAGAAGRDTRGMIRQHQFTKVELVSITTPEQSMDEHERMLASAEEILRRLGLHYRVVTLSTGDLGFASQKTYDIEVWLPGQGAYREISSCSVCGDFQARRMQARYRGKDGKVRLVHTLNGSGVAVGRALIAVMETYQQGNGSIAVPDVLAPYMGGLTVIGETG